MFRSEASGRISVELYVLTDRRGSRERSRAGIGTLSNLGVSMAWSLSMLPWVARDTKDQAEKNVSIEPCRSRAWIWREQIEGVLLLPIALRSVVSKTCMPEVMDASPGCRPPALRACVRSRAIPSVISTSPSTKFFSLPVVSFILSASNMAHLVTALRLFCF